MISTLCKDLNILPHKIQINLFKEINGITELSYVYYLQNNENDVFYRYNITENLDHTLIKIPRYYMFLHDLIWNTRSAHAPIIATQILIERKDPIDISLFWECVDKGKIQVL